MHEITVGLVFSEIRRMERLLIQEHEAASKHSAALEESNIRIGEIEDRLTILRADVAPRKPIKIVGLGEIYGEVSADHANAVAPHRESYWPPGDLGDDPDGDNT